MKTRKLRLVSALLALAMLLAMVPVGAWADTSTATGTGPDSNLAIDANGLPYNITVSDSSSADYRKGTGWEYKLASNRDSVPSLVLTSGIFNFPESTPVKCPVYFANGVDNSTDVVTIAGGVFEGNIGNNSNTQNAPRNITGGTFKSDVNFSGPGTISNATFESSVTTSTNRSTTVSISDITFCPTSQSTIFSIGPYCNVSSGNFTNGTVQLYGTNAKISGGAFHCSVETGVESFSIENRTTSVPIFYNAVTLGHDGCVNGGVFKDSVTIDPVYPGVNVSISRGIFFKSLSGLSNDTVTLPNEGMHTIKIEHGAISTVNSVAADANYQGPVYVVGVDNDQKVEITADRAITDVGGSTTYDSNTTVSGSTVTFTSLSKDVTLNQLEPPAKKTPSADDFELDADAKKVTGKNGINDNDIESVAVKDSSGNTKTVTGNDLSKLDPGTYTVVSVTTKENDNFTADTVTMPDTDAWKFAIKDTTTGSDDNNNNTTPDDGNNDAKTPTYPVSRGDYTEVTVTAPDGTKRDDDKAEKGDTVRVTLPEEDRKKGDMVFDGWDVIVEPEEKTADVLNELVKSGFKPGEPDTSFTMPELPEGTTLKFAPRYVTPDQSGSSNDSFLLTAAVVTGGAVVTGVVVYNVYARSYLKANLPEGAALPQNREELALLLWNKAGCPAPADSTLYTDMDAADANAQAAARWAVENELLKPADKKDGNVFKPEKSVSVGQAYRAWKKAEALG